MSSRKTRFDLRVPRDEIAALAERYHDPREALVVDELAPVFRSRGYLTQSEFLDVCLWKSPRTQSRCAANSAELIEEITRIALGTKLEQLRIEILTLLRGVGWPTASVILHFGHHDAYPILDFRALWSLGIEQSVDYDFAFWQAYTAYCRELAADLGVSMRVLDRALWQYSYENQRPGDAG